MSDMTIEEIESNIQGYSDDELVNLSNDERVGVKDAVAKEQERRASSAQEEAVAAQEGYVRYEDDPKNFPTEEGFEPASLSAPEVDPEESRKDDTTVLASDQFDSSGNRL